MVNNSFVLCTLAFSHLNPDKVIQSSPPPDDTIYASPQDFRYVPRSSLLLPDTPHSDIPMFNDLLFDDDLPLNDPPLNEPFEDVPPTRSPACDNLKSPLQDETSFHHPLINGVYTVIILLCPC